EEEDDDEEEGEGEEGGGRRREEEEGGGRRRKAEEETQEAHQKAGGLLSLPGRARTPLWASPWARRRLRPERVPARTPREEGPRRGAAWGPRARRLPLSLCMGGLDAVSIPTRSLTNCCSQ
ncbi:unnamed protein product, partial [Prorocentrum cordatum]